MFEQLYDRGVGKEADAGAVWGSLLQLFLGSQHQRFHQLADTEGLTVRTIHALLDLSPDEPQPMNALAEQWFCDASNVTGIVDALEVRGLASREAHASDRRVKLVRLTDVGAAVRARCVEHLSQPPPGLLRLSSDELRTLRPLVERAAEGEAPVA
ncbi:MAG: MarR family transcriptional regulator [Acidimicrobiales bacterium]|jgi:DNA-binding MarR family transcriptional regulator|nr:MarR family transcriptional regulator [Acidimicrobiales bacterium]